MSDPLLSSIASRRPPEALVEFKLHDINPYDLPGIQSAVEILLSAKEQQSTVICVVDYDTDGICSGAVLREGLTSLGLNVGIMVTDRYEDGYGFSAGACDKLLELKDVPGVIVTADLGSSDGVEIERYQSEMAKNGKKIPFIVTDHHHISKLTPPATADAFINPGRTDVFHVFNHPICGAAVAWMLVYALSQKTPSHFDPYQLLDLVAVATVGDMVSLSNTLNRALVKEGLFQLNQMNRYAWRVLAESKNKSEFKEDDIAFQIAPRINALSRMGDDGQTALTWLSSDMKDASEAAFINMEINNDERKDEQAKCQKLALSQAKSQMDSGVFVCVCFVPEFTHGVVGLAASHVVKETGLPAIVISLKSNGMLTGSARSIPGFDLRLAIEKAQDHTGLLTKYGGHAMAAGLSMNSADDIEAFHSALNTIASEMLNHERPEPTFFHDGELTQEMQSVESISNLQSIGPFGQDYPYPAFLVKGLVTGVKLLGKEFQHAKLTLSSGETLMWFNHDGLADKATIKIMEFIVSPTVNSWNGRQSVQYIVQAARMS
ncbi:MAG: hypothetical protein IBX55_01675 [Methyloprofundus sp.]|nr:hypothetical protein [Methyloprofundus sp.]